jgi:hypothetical protein
MHDIPFKNANILKILRGKKVKSFVHLKYSTPQMVLIMVLTPETAETCPI